MAFKEVFKRVEKKYMLTSEQYESFLPALNEHMQADEYGDSLIMNIYYDSPNYALIRRSIDKPVYKEKIRLRCYGVPKDDTVTFVELKKKYKGVVFKRRISMKYADALKFLAGEKPPKDSQIAREIKWSLDYYANLKPAVVLSYRRVAYFGREDPDFRMTFDREILWRDTDVDLSLGPYGEALLPEGTRLMEVKFADAAPLWLVDEMGRLNMYPTSFSKYGTAYKSIFMSAHGTDEKNKISIGEKTDV